MSPTDRGSWFSSWLIVVSWLVAAVLLGVVVGTPALRLEAPTLAWIVTVGIVAFALTRLTHLAVLRRVGSPGLPSRAEPCEPRRGLRKDVGRRGHVLVRHASSLYKGRSHSGERPRFD
jgi:hypothetical protein